MNLFLKNIQHKKSKKKQVYVNLTNLNKFKTTWMIILAGASNIKTTDEIPIACSSANYIFDEIKKKTLSEYRLWLKNYIRQKDSLIYYRETKLVNKTMMCMIV